MTSVSGEGIAASFALIVNKGIRKRQRQETMADDNDRRYCVVDHANKQADRDGVNPNRAARRRRASAKSAEKRPDLGRPVDIPGDRTDDEARQVLTA